jgi:hypothetical protein
MDNMLNYCHRRTHRFERSRCAIQPTKRRHGSATHRVCARNYRRSALCLEGVQILPQGLLHEAQGQLVLTSRGMNLSDQQDCDNMHGVKRNVQRADIVMMRC